MSNLENLDESGLAELESIVSDYNDRYRRGEQPNVEEYVARYPRLAEEIRETLPVLKKLRDLTPALPSAEASEVMESIPERIGDYRILGELGRGGMGVVYHAVQESLDRTVALKVLPGSALLNRRSRERFQREALIAARLHHTNIVPVFGTGEADGVHYYAMQYIEGDSLDRIVLALQELEPDLDSAGRCQITPVEDSGRLVETTERLLKGHLTPEDDVKGDASVALSSALSSSNSAVSGYPACVARIGIQIAQALAYAHAHGVLHRDIKPSNLILDHSGTIWVTDFGLARLDDQAGLTSTGDLVGTLRYMAPERLKGEVDTRTDIYALGLTLYELLTFRPALDEHDRGRLLQSIVESEPTSPSVVKRWIPRDLDTIVMKAMSKEPDRRYASAQAMAADLDRFLLGKAVNARPISSLGRGWRWCRRNRVVTGLAATLLLVLVTSLAIVTWQWRRAEANFELAEGLRVRGESSLVEANRQRDRAEVNFLRARQAVDDYLVTISESMLLDVPTLEPVRAELLERAKSFYEGFVEEKTDDPRLQAELAASYIRLGQIEHDLGGDWLSLFTRGLEIVEDLSDRGVSFTDFRSWREGVYNTRSGYLRTSDVEEFSPIVERAIAIWEPLVKEHPEVDGFRADLAGLFQMRGMVRFNIGEYDTAYEDFDRSRQLREPLVEQHPDVEKYRYALGESYTACGMVKLRIEKYDEALSFSTKAKELLEPIAEDNPAATRLADILAAIHQWIAMAHLQKGDPVLALSAYQQALDIQERLSREYPYEPHFQMNLATSYQMLGQSLFKAGQVTLAMNTYEKCFELLKQRMEDYPEKTEYRGAIANAYLDFSNSLYLRKEYQDAEQAARDALTWSDVDDLEHGDHRSLIYYRLGLALEAQTKYEETEESFKEAIAVARATDTIHPGWLVTYLDQSARNLERLERFADAEQRMQECITLRADLENASPDRVALGRLFRGRMLEKLERLNEAEAEYRACVELACQQGSVETSSARDAINRLVELLRRLENGDRADELLAEIRSHCEEEHGRSYGPEWTVAAYDLDENVNVDDDRQTDWSEIFKTTAGNTLNVTALDLVWNKEPFATDISTERFALVARCDWELGPDSVELHVHYGDMVRVYVDDELVFHGALAILDRRGTATITSTGKPVAVRVEHIQRQPGPSRLRLWAMPVTPE